MMKYDINFYLINKTVFNHTLQNRCHVTEGEPPFSEGSIIIYICVVRAGIRRVDLSYYIIV